MVILNRVNKKDLQEKVTLGRTLPGDERISHVDMGKHVFKAEGDMYKGSEVGGLVWLTGQEQ